MSSPMDGHHNWHCGKRRARYMLDQCSRVFSGMARTRESLHGARCESVERAYGADGDTVRLIAALPTVRLRAPCGGFRR